MRWRPKAPRLAPRHCTAVRRLYIGGTKTGALFGEAVVISRPELLPHFFTLVKQHGALLAKGRLTGIQFETLFTDGLYLRIARQAINTALKLKAAMLDKGYRLHRLADQPTVLPPAEPRNRSVASICHLRVVGTAR